MSLPLYPEAGGTLESAMVLLAAARATPDKHGVTKPIWNTEVNYVLTGTPVEPAQVKEQQAKVARTHLLNATDDIGRPYWNGWDQQQILDTIMTEPDAATVTPAGRAFATVQSWVAGGVLDSCPGDAAGTFTCTLRRSDGVRRAYWNPSVEVPVELPRGASTGYRIGGAPWPVPAEGTPLPVGPVPLMVESAA